MTRSQNPRTCCSLSSAEWKENFSAVAASFSLTDQWVTLITHSSSSLGMKATSNSWLAHISKKADMVQRKISTNPKHFEDIIRYKVSKHILLLVLQQCFCIYDRPEPDPKGVYLV